MLYSKSWSWKPSDLATRQLKEAPEAPAEPVQPDGPAMTEQAARIQNFEYLFCVAFSCALEIVHPCRRKRRI